MRSEKSVVLLDELHRCSKKEQEQFLTILEDGYLETPSGQKFTNHNLTFIGATTELSEIIPPLFDRFPIKPFLDEYTDLEMAQIVKRFAALSYLSLSDDDAVKLGKATGGVPRNAGSLIKMMHDMTYTLNRYPTIPEVLTECRVTEGGLTEYHQEYLRALRKSGGQAGLDTIGNYLRLPKTVVQDLEKLLLKKELIIYSKTGRQLSDQGWVTTEK
jgi:Holliday junction resolvasome RuvABC ATP-dependent DNA helicase subunit